MNLFRLYKDGFKHMSKDGKLLWKIALLKIFIMFAVIKVFFYPQPAHKTFKTEQEKAEHFYRQYSNDSQQQKHLIDQSKVLNH